MVGCQGRRRKGGGLCEKSIEGQAAHLETNPTRNKFLGGGKGEWVWGKKGGVMLRKK